MNSKRMLRFLFDRELFNTARGRDDFFFFFQNAVLYFKMGNEWLRDSERGTQST